MISTVEDDFEDGNEAYVRGDYLAAISYYKKAGTIQSWSDVSPRTRCYSG